MNLSDFSYELPETLIAQKSCSPRDAAKLMIINTEHDNNTCTNSNKNSKIIHNTFKDIHKYFKKGDVLVLNNTRVLHAKLIGKKESGSPAEIIILKKVSKAEYEVKIKTRNPHIGTKILLKKGVATIISQKNIDTYVVKIDNNTSLKYSILPTPPYIHRILKDSEYQTTFSKEKGSLAAPTAGLHFTKKLLKKIEIKGVKIAYITLHVSYGTFKNIDDIKTYKMDPEWYSISQKTADIINNRTGKLIVCGTTTLKTLETASRTSKNGKIVNGSGESTLFIYPPYKFKSGTDALITNFHLPKSTLLLLTCAFGGKERILDAYNIAVMEKYRFFSLGDAMMIWR